MRLSDHLYHRVGHPSPRDEWGTIQPSKHGAHMKKCKKMSKKMLNTVCSACAKIHHLGYAPDQNRRLRSDQHSRDVPEPPQKSAQCSPWCGERCRSVDARKTPQRGAKPLSPVLSSRLFVTRLPSQGYHRGSENPGMASVFLVWRSHWAEPCRVADATYKVRS